MPKERQVWSSYLWERRLGPFRVHNEAPTHGGTHNIKLHWKSSVPWGSCRVGHRKCTDGETFDLGRRWYWPETIARSSAMPAEQRKAGQFRTKNAKSAAGLRRWRLRVAGQRAINGWWWAMGLDIMEACNGRGSAYRCVDHPRSK